MMDYPRFFGFCEVPEYEGEPLLVARGDREYSFYCDWLVEYLEAIANVEIPESQKKLCADLDLKEPDSAAFWLGHDGFYHLLDYETLERCLEEGLSYGEAEKDLRGHWEQSLKDSSPDVVGPFEEWINPSLWEEAKRELAEEKAMPLLVGHFDVGYRVPLARVLARVPSRLERLKLIDTFYYAFHEEASK